MKWHNNEWLDMWAELTIWILNCLDVTKACVWEQKKHTAPCCINSHMLMSIFLGVSLVSLTSSFLANLEPMTHPKTNCTPWCSWELLLNERRTWYCLFVFLPKTVPLYIGLQQQCLPEIWWKVICLLAYAGPWQTINFGNMEGLI